jgi:chitinase
MRQQLTTKILAVFPYVIPIFAGNSNFFRGVDPCPVLCTVASSESVNWTVLHDPTRFRYCLQDILLDFAIYTPVDQDNVSTAFRACTSTYADETSTSTMVTNSTINSKQTLRGNETQAQLQFLWSNSSTPGIGPQAISAAKHIQGFFGSGASENYKSLFVNSGDAVLGVYIGSQLEKSTIVTKTLQTYIDEILRNGISRMLSLQLCGSGRNGNHVFGIIADTGPSAFSVVQSAVRSWSDAKCFTEYQGSRTMDDSGLYEDTNDIAPLRIRSTYKDQLRPRAVCTTIQVVSGDTCATLATRCGISGAAFTAYNTASTLCSTLVAGQHVCCSSGTLPDFTPKQNSDGSCYAYAVKSGDFCASLAASYGITVALIETYNINTWGWNTCSNLQIGTNMCLSSGTPPMPAPLSNAICGPQVPGTAPPSTMTLASMAALNPCPLKAWYASITLKEEIPSLLRLISRSV